MSEKYSDVIVVGTDLAGLIAGAFLAKRGLSITVLNFEKDVSLEKKNIQPNLITHLESRLFKSILGRLSILDHELNVIRKLEIPYQVVLPRHRIDVFRDRDRFFREIQREFPTDSEKIRSFYDGMDHFEATVDNESLQNLILPKGLKKRWKFGKFVKATGLNQRISEYIGNLGSNEEVRAFLESQLKFLSTTHSENPFTYQIAKTLSNDHCLLFDVRGGIGHLKKIFLDKIEAYSGRVKNEVQIESLAFEKSRIQAIKLGGFEGMVGCRYLLWNDEIRTLRTYLPKTFRSRGLLKKIQGITPRYYHFSIQYEMDPQVIPVGMRENLLLIGHPGEDLTGDNFLHLNLYHPAEDAVISRSLLTASYLLPAENLKESSEFFNDLHQKITQKLHQLMPFSEGKIRLNFPLEDKMPETEGMLFALEKGDFDIFRENAAANPIYEVLPRKFGELFPLNNRTPYKNLFLTGPEILAALGFEGKFLLGLKTTDLIWNEVEVGQKKAIRQRKIA